MSYVIVLSLDFTPTLISTMQTKNYFSKTTAPKTESSIWPDLVTWFFLGLFMFGLGAGGTALWDQDEPNNSVAIREMNARGDWIVPTFNGGLRTDKPILNYWLMKAGTAVFGMNELGLRAGSVLCGALIVVLAGWWADKLYGRYAGWGAALVLSTILHHQAIFRAAVPDPVFILFVNICLLSFLSGYIWPDHRNKWYLTAYISAGLAVLAKGPIGVLLPGLIIVVFLLLRRDLPHIWRSTRPVLGFFLFAAVVLPWYGAVWLATDGAWVKGFIFDHNINRYTDSKEGHSGPLFYYLITLPLALLPWSAVLVQSLAAPVKQLRHSSKMEPPILFFLVWAMVWIAFFSSSGTKLPNYIIPAYSPLALLIGIRLARAWNKDDPLSVKGLRAGAVFLGVVGFLLSVTGALILPRELPGLRAMPELGLPYLAASVFLFIRPFLYPAVKALFLSAIAVMLLLIWNIKSVDELKVSRRFGHIIHAEAGDRPYTLAYSSRFQPSFLYYGGTRIKKLDGPAGTVRLLAGEGTDEKRDEKTVFIILKEEDLASLKEKGVPFRVLAKGYDMYARKSLTLITNKIE